MRFLLALLCLACADPEPAADHDADAERAPTAEPAPDVDPQPPASVLVARWSDGLAMVACVSEAGVQTGPPCAALLPAGTELGPLGTSTGPTPLPCRVPGDEVPGIGIVGGEPMLAQWAWVPAPPKGWTEASLEPADDVLAALIRRHAEATEDVEVGIALHAELDGDPSHERIARTFAPEDDPDKPGRSRLWLLDDDGVVPIPTRSRLQGVQAVLGMLPLDGGGALVAFTSQWMGGSGVHALTAVEGQLVALGEATCGS